MDAGPAGLLLSWLLPNSEGVDPALVCIALRGNLGPKENACCCCCWRAMNCICAWSCGLLLNPGMMLG